MIGTVLNVVHRLTCDQAVLSGPQKHLKKESDGLFNHSTLLTML